MECAIVRTAFAATYPPRRCGIASFTSDLARVTPDREVVAIQAPQTPSPSAVEVHHRIRRDVGADYETTGRWLHECAAVASIQHDFGIWGNEDGEGVLSFARALRIPAVATLHSIPLDPSSRQREILRELVALMDTTVVMSASALPALLTGYGIGPDRVEVIPHGVPDLPLVPADSVKPSVGLQNRNVLLSFGLLAPGKGLEFVLEALPAVVARHPATTYVIVGPTHPDVLGRDGEAYRNSLIAQVARLRMSGHVEFVDRFVGRVELTRWLEAADIVVTQDPNADHTVSGTLSYAMGAGRAIVSTAYPYAVEVLGDNRGMVVPPSSPDALAVAINLLLDDPERRLDYGRRAHDYSRDMVWSNVGERYGRLFARVAASAGTVAHAGR